MFKKEDAANGCLSAMGLEPASFILRPHDADRLPTAYCEVDSLFCMTGKQCCALDLAKSSSDALGLNPWDEYRNIQCIAQRQQLPYRIEHVSQKV